MTTTAPLSETRTAATSTAGTTVGRLADLPFTALGGQPGFAPDDLERFVAAARVAVLAYVRKDGRPGQVPVWYTYTGGAFHLATSKGTPKHLALARDPRVCLTIQDERPPYRAVIVDAVAEITDLADDGPTAGIEDRYFGRIGGRIYRDMVADDPAERIEITIRPTAVRGFDNTTAISPPTLAFARMRPHLPLLRRWL